MTAADPRIRTAVMSPGGGVNSTRERISGQMSGAIKTEADSIPNIVIWIFIPHRRYFSSLSPFISTKKFAVQRAIKGKTGRI